MTTLLWHPHAKRVPMEDAGTFTGGGAKFCVHTTEGSSAEGAIATYRANRDAPHFTLAVQMGKRALYQHIPINRAARSLQHTLPPETNRANVWQVEVVGFTAQSPDWPDELYHYLHLLFMWVHRHAGVPMVAHHPFPGHRFTGEGWVKAEGLVGHCHCPGNTHVDPGALNVHKALTA